QTAGRPGTKKFIDPNKVFIGNLPFDATEEDVNQLFATHWGRIESVKIVRDWKSGKSKGYGFIQFYEPMVATSAMKSVNEGKGLRIKGRPIRLDQGARKEDGEKVGERGNCGGKEEGGFG
ncbi:RNA binding protein, partial [Thalassiosira pseudonana CCMP1335]